MIPRVFGLHSHSETNLEERLIEKSLRGIHRIASSNPSRGLHSGLLETRNPAAVCPRFGSFGEGNEGVYQSPKIRSNLRAQIITNTISGVPYYDGSIMGPETLF